MTWPLVWLQRSYFQILFATFPKCRGAVYGHSDITHVPCVCGGGVLRLIPCPLKRFIRVQISPLFCLFFLGTETQGLLQILHHYKANVFHKPLILKLFSLPWTFCLCCLTCCSKHHTTHGRRTLLRSWQYRGKLARRVSSTMKHRQTCL